MFADNDQDCSNIKLSNDGNTAITYNNNLNIYKFDTNQNTFGFSQTIKPNNNGDLFSSAAISDSNARIITSMSSASGNYLNIY
jgi:hypothetical protein